MITVAERDTDNMRRSQHVNFTHQYYFSMTDRSKFRMTTCTNTK